MRTSCWMVQVSAVYVSFWAKGTSSSHKEWMSPRKGNYPRKHKSLEILATEGCISISAVHKYIEVNKRADLSLWARRRVVGLASATLVRPYIEYWLKLARQDRREEPGTAFPQCEGIGFSTPSVLLATLEDASDIVLVFPFLCISAFPLGRHTESSSSARIWRGESQSC